MNISPEELQNVVLITIERLAENEDLETSDSILQIGNLCSCRVFFPRILIMLMYFLCFRARDIVVMQSVTKFRA